MTRIGFAGLSHLGIVSSVAAAAKGCEVVAYDPDASLVARLAQGALPMTEAGLAELLAAHRTRLTFSSDPRALEKCELLVCAADVPTDRQSRSDVVPVRRLLETLVTHAPAHASVVILSQVSPGFTRAVDETVSRSHADRGLQVYYQVETLVIGQAVERALAPQRIIVGCRDVREPLASAYAHYVKAFACPLLTMRYESAELAKIAVNLFLVSQVCTTNMLAELCETIGADWSEIVPALRSDPRIGPSAYLAPGLGVSGGNLERDVVSFQTLARAQGTEAGLIDAWLTNSRHRKGWVARLLDTEVYAAIREPRIAMWGLAYKLGTASTKNAPSLALLQSLRLGTVRVYDPHVRLERGAAWNVPVEQTPSAREACREADALVILTPWPEFASASLPQIQELMRGRVVIDPFGVLDGMRCAALGFRHFTLGTLRLQPQPSIQRAASRVPVAQ